MATDKWFVVVNRATGLVFDIDSFIPDVGASLTQWKRTDADNQLFRFVDSGNNYYRIIAQHSGLAIDVSSRDTNDGADIIQWTDSNAQNQQFQIFDLRNGYYQIVNRNSGKALAPLDYSAEPAASISQYTRDDHHAQQWQLIAVANYGGAAGGADGDYYVALNGNDSNPGTIERPFRSLQKAIDTAGPGDLVLVRGGVYNIVNLVTRDAGVHFGKSGTSADKRIRYFAFPGERPIFDFSQLRIRPDPNYTYGFSVTGSYLHIKGFELRNLPMNTRSNVGLRVEGNAYRNIFEQLDIHHISGTGMFISGTRGGHLILNSDAHDNYDPDSHQGDGQNADGFGVHYQESGEPTIFRGCRAWWNSDDGWDFISQEVPVIVENSWAMGNGYSNSGRDRPRSGNGAGFKMGSSKTGIRHVIRNNLAWGNRNQGFYANHSAGGNDWFNNTSYNNGAQFDMLASSWDSSGKRTDGVILTGNKVHRMRNNIGFPDRNRNMQGVDAQSNTWNLGITPANNDFLSVSDTGTKGPRNPDGSLPVLDFLKLRNGSQMIDRGVNVDLKYSGAAPDLGAYER